MQRFFDGLQRCDDNLNIQDGHKHADAQGDKTKPTRHKGQGVNLVSHRLIIPIATLLTLAIAIWPVSSFAMNWEGHDEWFHDNTLFEKFIEGVPPPLLKPLPQCLDLMKRHEENVYEQTPLPGKNCLTAKPQS